MEGDIREQVQVAQEEVTVALGPGVVADRAQAGSRTHRVRQYWTNGVSEATSRYRLSLMERSVPPGGRHTGAREDAGISGAARPPDAVSLQRKWQKPTALERELAMGFMEDATTHPEVTEAERRRALGRAMVLNVMHWLVATIRMYHSQLRWERKRDKTVAVQPPTARSTAKEALSRAMLGEIQDNEEVQHERGHLLEKRWVYPWEEDEERPAVYAEQTKIWLSGDREEAAVDKKREDFSWLEEAIESMAPHVPTLARSSQRVEEEESQPRQEAGEKEWEIGKGMAEADVVELKKVLAKYRPAFAYSLKEVGRCNMVEVTLELTTDIPVYQMRRRMTAEETQICKEKCQGLLEAGFIWKSNSEYAAATVVATRTDLTGNVLSKRMCGDYRGMNKKKVMKSGGRQRKAAFHEPDGQYEWNFLQFGLKSASPEFQWVMDQVLREVQNDACYIDDVIVFSTDSQSHVKDVEAALSAIQSAGLTCHPRNCKFGQMMVEYLGFEVEGGKIRIQKAKVEVLDRVATPKDKTTLRALLGFLNYYRKFVPNFSSRASALNQLLREDRPWEWGPEQERAVQDLMGAVKNRAVQELPTADLPFTLYTNWSSAGMGAVLAQMKGGMEKVVAFASRSCNVAEANYSSYEGEGLAVVWAVKHFWVYLQGRKFTLVTDHQPLLWLMQTSDLTGRNARWAMKMQEYDFEIKHRPGKTMQHVDGLSRNPPKVQLTALLTKFVENEGRWRPEREPEGTAGQGRTVEARAMSGALEGSARATRTGAVSGVTVMQSRKKQRDALE
ncbi:unnamed protein product [Closterium sp. NIES-53]